MKNLKSLYDSELLNEVRSLAARERERETGLEVLYRLREIESRKLYALNYSSLHEFVVHELKYSDGSAHRRIAAMRLLRELPAVEESLKSGEFTLSNASQMHDFLRAEKKQGKTYTPEEKTELFEELLGKSTREVQETLAEKSPLSVPRGTIRPINGEESKLTLVIDKNLQNKLERLKGLLAHRIPGAGYAELLDTLADMALKQLDPREKPVRKSTNESASARPKETVSGDIKLNTQSKTKTNLNQKNHRTPFASHVSSQESQAYRMHPTHSSQTQKNQAIPMGAPPAPTSELKASDFRSCELKFRNLKSSPPRSMGSSKVSEQKSEVCPESSEGKSAKSAQFPIRSRYIPSLTRRQVWVRSQGRCEHLHDNGSRCNTRYALEIDHKHPYAKNGSHELENLQLLCRTHNSYKNLRDYGFLWKEQQKSA